MVLPSYRAARPEPVREAADVAGVHRGHCCRKHGCKYGNEACPVVTGEALQRYACVVCDDEIEDNWDTYQAANEAYDAGRRAGQGEGYQHGFSEGTFRGFRQGRIWAETGRMEPLGTLPYPLAGEVTEEMVEAFGKGWEQADTGMRYLDPDSVVPGTRRRGGLMAVLAILRREAAHVQGERT